MVRPFLSRLAGKWSWWPLLVVVVAVAALGCEDPHETKTTMFESAETEYRQGNYEAALQGYQAFLQQYPDSSLRSTVEMRIRSIHREVASVMERTGSPRPSYHGSDGEQNGVHVDPAAPPGE